MITLFLPCGASTVHVKSTLYGWLIIIGCYLVGEFFVLVTDLPLPGALIGLLLLLSGLLLRQRPAVTVGRGAQPLLTHMSVLFVPAVIGVGLFWAEVSENALGIALALVATTIVALGFTAWFAQRLMKAKRPN
ncbi:murein hydrolase transporter LrgA [Alteromonas alba]|uniref:Murein hydrolase transporter LrgA n=1 Tax=Alteromonas alba TaxID=2079529 RepID=A0A2S9V456_9ALTE|nr:murein hydrolase transporter LrgA [Alteromonas alba]